MKLTGDEIRGKAGPKNGRDEERDSHSEEGKKGPNLFARMKGLIASLAVLTTVTGTAMSGCSDEHPMDVPGIPDASVDADVDHDGGDGGGPTDAGPDADADVEQDGGDGGGPVDAGPDADADVEQDGGDGGGPVDAGPDADVFVPECSGVHEESVAGKTFYNGTPEEVGGYDMLYHTPEAGYRLEFTCSSDSSDVALDQTFAVGITKTIPVPADRMEIQVTVTSRNAARVIADVDVVSTAP